MAITYEVNGTGITAGVIADWEPIGTGGYGDGTQRLSTNWLRHIWRIAIMEMADYLVLTALRGAALTSLKTTQESNPNSTGTYATAKLTRISGQQQARQMLNVQVEFYVDVTS